MIRNLTNKTIIITGATSGIGRSLAKKLAESNAQLILVSRNKDKLQGLKDDLIKLSTAQVQIYQANLANREECSRVFKQIIEDNRKIDSLINNAGLGVFEYAHLIKAEDVDRMVNLNVLSVIETTRLIIPVFQAQQFGHIINVGSFAGKMATPKSAVYAATKSAVIAYSNAVRLEIESKSIFVTTVNPGPVRTAFFKEADPSGKYQKSVDPYMLTSDYVADKIINHLFKRKREINLPWWMAIGAKIHHQFPTLVEKVMNNQFNKK